MRLVLFENGTKYSVWAVDLCDDPAVPDCPVREYLAALEADNKRSHDSLLHVVEWHMNRGRISNDRKSRDEGDGIYAFKNSYGARILYFYLPGWRTILALGFTKKGDKLPPEHKQRALMIKARVLEELE